MANQDPRKPRRDEFARAFNNDQRMIRAFERLFDLIPDGVEGVLLQVQDAINQWIGPAIQSVQAQLYELAKKVNANVGLDIQNESSDYTLLLSDSGVNMSGSSTATMPDASGWADGNKFVHNVGTDTLTVIPQAGQNISGADFINLSPATPYSIAYMKSDGSNLILLSDRNDDSITAAVGWNTKFGEEMETKFGERLIFRL